MNYGKEFIKIYNSEFLKEKKDFKDYLQENFNSDYSFTTLTDNYRKKLSSLKKKQYDKDNLITEFRDDFWFRYLKYDKNAAINIVNNEIKEKYEINLTRTSSKIRDFEVFSGTLARYCLAMDFEQYFIENTEKIKANFKKKDLSNVFKLRKKPNAEYLISYYKNRNSENQIENKTESKPEKKTTSKLFDNPFTKDEKILLMHYLLKFERSQEERLSFYELALILKLSSGGFENEKLIKIKDTAYEKIKNGIKHYSTKNRKDLFKTLLIKMKKFECIKFHQFIENEFYKL